MADELRAVDIPAVSTMRVATDEDIRSAVALIRERLDRLKDLDGVIEVNFGSGSPVYVDCKGGRLVDSGPP